MNENEPEKISKHRFILFYGPSCSGKTYYYSKQLCHTHRRISSEDLFKEDPGLGCRGVGLRIVSLLQQGHNVVLDDENYKIQTRRSYYTLIKKKVPDCSLLCLKFVAKYGNFQVQWLSEHCIVEAGLAHIPCKRTRDLNKWLDGVQDVPDEFTEQCKVEEIVSMPTIQSFYKFNVPGLIIEWCSVFSGRDEDVIQPALLQEMESWTHSYPDGRLIIVKTDVGNSYEDIKGKLMKLAKKVDTPVVAILLKGKCPFRTPPQPGLIAVLQRFLHLDIHCKATMYVYTTNQHKECAINAGVRHIKKETLCLVKSPCAVQPIVPKMFSDFMLTPPIGERKKYSVENEMLPLYEEAKVNSGFAKIDLDEDCTVYLAASNESLDRYQNGITKWVQKTPSDGCKITETSPKVVKPTISPNKATMEVEPTSLVNLTRTGSSRNLPKWMYTRSKDAPKRPKKRLRETTKKSLSLQCSIVKAMSESDLTDNAKHICQENNKPCLDSDSEPDEITILIDKPNNTYPVSEVSLEGNMESNIDELTGVVDTGELNEMGSRTTLAPASIEEESYIDSILECKIQNGTSFQNNGNSKMETLESQSPGYDKGTNGAETPVSGAAYQGHVVDGKLKNSNIYESEYYLDTLPMFRDESQRPLKPPPKRKLTSPREDSKDPRVLKSKTKKKFTSPREDSNNPCVVESQGSSEKLQNYSYKCESEHYLDTLPMFRDESQRPLKPPPKRKLTSPREDPKDPRVQKSKTKYMSGNSSYLDDLGL
ncbi:unnamed protein product [Owenia fusiformis]|uniref:Uncharacterized protein n=1 Tax=Owenia fusiformis TaxID=6347 RepID=A0A8J1T5V5_OWEFU|nr:unnamed protein product [Owenia fusiformis]